jgi:phosphoribosylformylglycinamidine cyclo-ligase
MAHITGGGLLEYVPRMLAGDLAAVLDRGTWQLPPVFSWLQQQGGVADGEMHRVFNCGIGMIVVVAPADADRAQAMLATAGESVYRIGAVVPRVAGKPPTIVA